MYLADPVILIILWN